MTVYAIRQICESDAARPGRRVNCLSDSEALELAQKIAAAGLSLEVWRGDDLIGTIVPVQNAATSELVSTETAQND